MLCTTGLPSCSLYKQHPSIYTHRLVGGAFEDSAQTPSESGHVFGNSITAARTIILSTRSTNRFFLIQKTDRPTVKWRHPAVNTFRYDRIIYTSPSYANYARVIHTGPPFLLSGCHARVVLALLSALTHSGNASVPSVVESLRVVCSGSFGEQHHIPEDIDTLFSKVYCMRRSVAYIG